MPIHNSDVAAIFDEIADLLAIKGDNQFRVRSYRTAARTVSTLSRDVADMVEEGEDLTELSGVGDSLAGKIVEIVETGKLGDLESLREEIPRGVARMTSLPNIGPKRAATLYEELGVTTLDELEEAGRQGRIAELDGFGDKTRDNILEAIERRADREDTETRWKWIRAREYAVPLADRLREVEGVERVVIAGSFRRRKQTVGDLDILATCENAEAIMEAFVDYEDVDRVESRGETRSTVWLRNQLQVDLRVVGDEHYGAALYYFTGSKAHNVAVRRRGQRRDLKINEYGVFRDDDRIAGATEQEVFDSVDLDYIEPELREDRGEIEAAETGDLPELLEWDDMRGDLHMHTTATDGRNSIREMAEAAGELGHDYVAITDHSKNVTVAGGLDADELQKHIDDIERVDDDLDDIRVLTGIEVDILEDGSLDLPDEVLERLDVTVCSVHYHTDMAREEMTERIMRAMDNPNFNILGHPTGRRIHKRPGYDLDFERLVEAADQRGCVLEINAQPGRLDLDDHRAKRAREQGVPISISTDAHSTSELEYQPLGVAQARRGWLEADDVLNTRNLDDLLTLLKR